MGSSTRQKIAKTREEAAEKQSKVKDAKARRKGKLPPASNEEDAERTLRLEKRRIAQKKKREDMRNNLEAYERSKAAERSRWHRRVKDNKVRLIDQLSEREKRERRRKNRQYYLKWLGKKKELERTQECIDSSSEKQQDECNSRKNVSKQSVSGAARAKRNLRLIHRKNISLQAENQYYRRNYERLRKREQRRQAEESRAKSDSPRKNVKEMLHGTPVSENVKKRLLFGEVLRKQMSVAYKGSSSHRVKTTLSRVLSGKIVKKYRKLEDVKRLIAPIKTSRLTSYENLLEHTRSRSGLKQEVKNSAQEFFIANSTECPGKGDCITRNKEKKQKRYLNSTMGEMHDKFQLKFPHMQLSYVAFTRLRPFYVVPPKVSSRDTCLCLTHENMGLLVKALHGRGLIEENSSDKIINSITCRPRTELCLSRNCPACSTKSVKYLDCVEENLIITYQQWLTKKEERICGKSSKPIIVHLTTKESRTATLTEIIEIFEKFANVFMQHVYRIEHQYKAMTECKLNLTGKELKILADFNENYNCKYGTEPQSVHFGASRQQVTLHTGMAYTEDFQEGFATLSPSLKHDPLAIAVHFTKILDHYLERFPLVETLHFLSDGPTTQYRNRKMFYLVVNYLTQRYPKITSIIYNFSEAGHGKGAADGIGAVIKRTADRLVAEGNDINNFDILLKVVKERCSNMFISSVSETDIQAMEPLLPPDIPTFTGTMKVHQYKWHRSNPDLINFNSLSCNDCKPNEKCIHYHLGQLSYSTSRKRKSAKKMVDSTKKTVKKKNDVKAKQRAVKKKDGAVKTSAEASTGQTRKSNRVKRGKN